MKNYYRFEFYKIISQDTLKILRDLSDCYESNIGNEDSKYSVAEIGGIDGIRFYLTDEELSYILLKHSDDIESCRKF